ncbi:putative DNA polymerase epsilon subunit C [Cladorrhinum sp. PSN259]|nr:putative DNA polymerase epsilon subunit C [Cladorrhinum sp. PSN259]
MAAEGTSYAPRSPDLSSFYSAGPTPPAEQQPPAQSQRWPLLSEQAQQPRSQQFSPQAHLQQPSTYFSGPPAPPPTSNAPYQQQHLQPQHFSPFHEYQYQQSQQQQEQQQQPEPPKLQLVTPPQTVDQGYYSSQPFQPQPQFQSQIPGQPPIYSPYFPRPRERSQTSYTAPSPQSAIYQPSWYSTSLSQQVNASPSQHHQQQPYTSSTLHSFQQGRQQAQQQLDVSYLAHDDTNKFIAMPPKRSAASAAQPPAPAVEPSPVKTKFPTARIKRIMQADEEVGKVAQQTPIAVGKALEMFMVALVTKSADVAREKNSKRVSAQMLKQVVESDEQWDFLREIVSKVENTEDRHGKGSASKAKSQGDSEESEEEVVPEKKKRAGRKKKV